MKKLLLATLLFTGLAALAQKAEARSYDRECRGHDRYGRPIYVYVPSRSYYSEPRYRSYSYAPVYRSYRSYDYYRPSYRSYDNCRPNTRYYSSRPRVAITFGF